jgi:hypothetical protein
VPNWPIAPFRNLHCAQRQNALPFLTIQHLACDNFKIAFRSPMSSVHVSAVQADNHFFTRFLDRRSREGFSGLFKPLSDLHSAIAHGTDRCFADAGKSSPRKSATLPNGTNAAILAVRYLNFGVIGLQFVKGWNTCAFVSHCTDSPSIGECASRHCHIHSEEWTGHNPSCETPFRTADKT